RGLPGESDTLYHQKPDGTFEDLSAKSGAGDTPHYYGFSSAFVHVNEDNLLDLVVVNDSTPKQLYLNKGDGTFEEVGYPSGIALNENGREQAGMGLAVGDYDNDGRVDFHITNFSDDSNVLYHNDGDGNFTDVTFQAGLGELTIPFLGWGTSFLDFDNDGWQDLVVANGHVYPGVDQQPWGTTFAQRPLLMRNLQGKKFEVIPALTGSGLGLPTTGRGLAVADLFNDGHLDIVINNLDGHPSLLRNEVRNRNHWVEFKLVGGGKSPADGIGASMRLSARGLRLRRDVISGGSYESSSDLRLHFGLGEADSVTD